LRVGIIGVGWGSVVQVPAFRMVPEYEVVALCSRQPDRVAAAGEKLGISDVSTDWKQFVTRDDIDIISVATPVDLHHEQTLAAIAAGKHVLVEKPLGLSEAETGEMLKAAQDAGVCHAVCFENRWEPARLKVWEMVSEGFLGTPYFGIGRTGADFWHPTRGLQSEWMYSKANGGGYLMGMGSHDIDYACALFGDPVAVCADVKVSVPKRPRADGSMLDVDADDTAALIIRMANGMTFNIITTAIALQENFRAFTILGSDGSLSMEGGLMGEGEPVIRAGSVTQEASTTIAASPRTARSGIEAPKRRAAGAINALALMLEEWLPAFDGQPTTVPTLYDGHRVQRIVDAARRSSDGAGWVAL
jgi:predicted dehydrogenase